VPETGHSRLVIIPKPPLIVPYALAAPFLDLGNAHTNGPQQAPTVTPLQSHILVQGLFSRLGVLAGSIPPFNVLYQGTTCRPGCLPKPAHPLSPNLPPPNYLSSAYVSPRAPPPKGGLPQQGRHRSHKTCPWEKSRVEGKPCSPHDQTQRYQVMRPRERCLVILLGHHTLLTGHLQQPWELKPHDQVTWRSPQPPTW
jgi:hypothetical protein